jgi:hypothetical protein
MKEDVFKLIEADNEKFFDRREPAINKNVRGQKDFWDFIGDIFDLFLPKFLSTVIGRDTSKSSLENDQT